MLLNLELHKLKQLDLPESTRHFLEKQAIKTDYSLLVSFSAENGTFPKLDLFCAAKGLPQLTCGTEYYRIGTDEGTELCVEKDTGFVYAIALSKSHHTRFVNSSLELFIKFLELYDSYAVAVQNLDETNALELVEQINERMVETDRSAFSDPDSWWSSITQQMEAGML